MLLQFNLLSFDSKASIEASSSSFFPRIKYIYNNGDFCLIGRLLFSLMKFTSGSGSLKGAGKLPAGKLLKRRLLHAPNAIQTIDN